MEIFIGLISIVLIAGFLLSAPWEPKNMACNDCNELQHGIYDMCIETCSPSGKAQWMMPNKQIGAKSYRRDNE